MFTARTPMHSLTRLSSTLLATILASSLAPSLPAQRLDLDRLFASGEFASARFGPARWLDDGAAYTTLEPGRRGLNLVRYDTRSGRRRVLVTAERLLPDGRDRPLRITDYAWSRNGKELLVFTNARRVWRTNTRGDYWVLDMEKDELKKIGGKAEPSSLMFATFSPDGTRVAYVHHNDLYVQHLGSGKIVQLTHDGSKSTINGTFDWVYEEEFFLHRGFRWSPDGKRIAYWQLDSSGVRNFVMIDNVSGLYPRTITFPYPKTGTTNSACRVGVVPAAGGETRWMKVPGDPRQHYLARMDWAASSGELWLQQLNRVQNTNLVMLCDAATGAVRTVLTEHDAAWVDVRDDMHWLAKGSAFTWVSERDGWRHLWLAPRAGGEAKLLTPGKYDLLEVTKVDERGGWIWLIASPDHPTRRFLYRVPLGGGPPERITPEPARGTHAYSISPDGRFAIHTWSAFGRPPVTDLVSLPEHHVLRVLEDNARLRRRVDGIAKGESGFFRIDIGDGVALDGWYVKPPDFDPKKRYPVLFHVYGEPWAQTVLDEWGVGYYLWNLFLSQQGYVVMSVDNRGTPAPRGREWRKCVYRQIGILASRDQANAVRAIEKRWSWVDPKRIGIWGWSGGGSMSLNAIFRYPDVYQTAIAVAAVSNMRYYDTIYQERYMGLPSDNAEGYRQGSPITFARRLRGNLLIIHGTGDDNVHYQNFAALANELIRQGKQFSMMAYPGRSHGIYEGRGTRRHLFGLMTRYLEEHLPPGPKQ